MRSLALAVATQVQRIPAGHGVAPRLASALAMAVGALLVLSLPAASMAGAIPLRPLLTWLTWMALFGAAGVSLMAVLRVRRLERALERERSRFRAVTDVAAVAVCQFDPSGGIVFANAACHKLLGGTPQAWSGAPVFRGMHPDDRARLRERWQTAQHQGRPLHMDVRVSVGGGERWLSMDAVPLTTRDGRPQGTVCCFIDRTPEHRA